MLDIQATRALNSARCLGFADGKAGHSRVVPFESREERVQYVIGWENGYRAARREAREAGGLRHWWHLLAYGAALALLIAIAYATGVGR